MKKSLRARNGCDVGLVVNHDPHSESKHAPHCLPHTLFISLSLSLSLSQNCTHILTWGQSVPRTPLERTGLGWSVPRTLKIHYGDRTKSAPQKKNFKVSLVDRSATHFSIRLPYPVPCCGTGRMNHWTQQYTIFFINVLGEFIHLNKIIT